MERTIGIWRGRRLYVCGEATLPSLCLHGVSDHRVQRTVPLRAMPAHTVAWYRRRAMPPHHDRTMSVLLTNMIRMRATRNTSMTGITSLRRSSSMARARRNNVTCETRLIVCATTTATKYVFLPPKPLTVWMGGSCSIVE